MSSHGHKSHRRKPAAEAGERKPLLDENGDPVLDADGNPVYEDQPVEEPVKLEDKEEFKAYMDSVCTVAAGIEELTKRNCPAPDAARIAETIWAHQNGCSLRDAKPAE